MLQRVEQSVSQARDPRRALRRSRLLASLLLLSFLGSGITLADDSGEPDSLYMESIDVLVVNVDVFVTDRDGNPVLGLTRDEAWTRIRDSRNG